MHDICKSYLLFMSKKSLRFVQYFLLHFNLPQM